MNQENRSYVIMRWTARILSIASISLLLMFAVGERLSFAHFNAIELLQFLFFPVGICAGMIIAWWKEGLGGVVSVVSLLVFYTINFAAKGSFPRGWAFLAFSAPAVLFIISWIDARRIDGSRTASPD